MDRITRDPWVLGALLVGLALRLVRLDYAPLWIDEATTAMWLAMPWGDMVRSIVTDVHPPLYFVILKAWSTVAGNSAWALRLPSALASGLTVPLMAAAAGALAGRNAARWAAWLAALSPFVIHHGQEARMYAFVTALAAADFLLLVRFLSGTTRSLGWLFVATTAALVACHYYAVFFVGGEVLALLVLHPRPRRRWVPATVGASVAAAGALLFAYVVARHSAGRDYELGLLALPGTVWSMVSGYTLMPSSSALHASGWRAALPYMPVAAVAALSIAVTILTALRSAGRITNLVLACTLGVALVGPFVVWLVLPVAINPRYFAAAVPVLLTLMAIGAASSPPAISRMVATAVVVVILLAGTARHLLDPGRNREDVAAAGKWLDSHVPADEEIVITSQEMASLARFHWPNRRFQLYPAPGVVAGRQNASELANAFPFPAGDRAIYVIGREWLSDPLGALSGDLSARHPSCGGADLRGIRILCLERRDTGSAGAIVSAAHPREIE